MARTRQPTFFPLSFDNQDIYFAELDAIVDGATFDAKLTEVDEALGRMVGRENLIVHLEGTTLTRPRSTRSFVCWSAVRRRSVSSASSDSGP